MNWNESIYIIGLVIMCLIRLSFQHFDDQKQVKKNYISSKESIMMTLLLMFGFVLPFTVYYILPEWHYSVPLWLQVIGTLMLLMSMVLFWRSHVDLDRQFSPTLQIKRDHQLIKSGIYKYIRHPMYAGAILLVIIQSILLPNVLSTLSLIVGIIVLYVLRIPAEEQMLIKEFGDEYRKYSQETCGLLPYICHIM